MEGRLRVSVVATGIEAEAMALPPEKLEPRRPQLRPVPLHATVRPVTVNPVHRQVETLAAEMEAEPANVQHPAPMSPAEQVILAHDEPEAIEDDLPPIPPGIRHTVPVPPRPVARQPIEEESRSVFGFLGRKKKPEPRMEPATRMVPQRATAQVMTRNVTAERTLQPATDVAGDLFPDHKKGVDVEIPAFLRRQAN